MRDGRLSLKQAINDPIKLEIYPDSNQTATGDLYLDDGENMRYQDDEKTYVVYGYAASGMISVEKVVPDIMTYAKSARKVITSIEIFGIENKPESVENLWAEQRAPN